MEADDFIQVMVLSLLLIVGVILCALYLMSVNICTKVTNNAAEVLQFCKTILILAGLILFMPLELYTLFGLDKENRVLCCARELLEHLLLESQPMVIVAIAIIRIRASLCLGSSFPQISIRSALLTLSVCFMFPLISTLVKLAMMLIPHEEQMFKPGPQPVNSPLDVATCAAATSSFATKQRNFMLISMILLPTGITISLYGVTYLLFRTKEPKLTTTSVFNSVRIENHRRSFREMKQTIIIMFVTILISWVPYLIMAFKMMDRNIDLRLHLVVTCYIKMILLVHQPFCEGFLHRRRRNNMKVLFLRVFTKSEANTSRRYILPDTSLNVLETGGTATEFVGESRPGNEDVIHTDGGFPTLINESNRSSGYNGNSRETTEESFEDKTTVFCISESDSSVLFSPFGSSLHFDDITNISSESRTDLNDIYGENALNVPTRIEIQNEALRMEPDSRAVHQLDDNTEAPSETNGSQRWCYYPESRQSQTPRHFNGEEGPIRSRVDSDTSVLEISEYF